MLCFYFCFFFFQAEDGIRDLYVTGVQTCALPICGQLGFGIEGVEAFLPLTPKCALYMPCVSVSTQIIQGYENRSEERRVGKECRSRWSADPLKKKCRGAR